MIHMKNLKFVLSFLLLIICFLGCEKEVPPPLNTVTSEANIVPSYNTAVASGAYSYPTSISIKIWISLHKDMSEKRDFVAVINNNNSFIINMIDLKEDTTYYYQYQYLSDISSDYGEIGTFKTLAYKAPVLTTNNVTVLSATTATSGGNINDNGGLAISGRGICWSTTQNPTISNSHTTDGSGTGNFTSSMTGLTPNTTYHVRAYAINSLGTGYGAQKSFTTSGGVAVLTTNIVTSIMMTTATCGGVITNDGGLGITGRGVCWSTSSTPTINNNHTNNGSGIGSFTSYITGLSKGTTYYVRAYATNSQETYYGPQRYFATLNGAAVVTTNTVSNISLTTATCGGNVTSNGGLSVTAKGICWSTLQNPTINNSHTTNGSGTGPFSSSLTGLTASTTYYVRAYATNSQGTYYGTQRSFTTTACNTTVTDYDGNSYNTIAIGSQCWMKQNLKSTHYADGTYISLGSTTSSTAVAYRYYPNNSSGNVSTYGYLYNWKAVMRYSSSSSTNPSGVQGICPTGWHVPSDAEWAQLTTYVGSQSAYQCGSNSTNIAKAIASTTGWNTSSITCAVGYNPSSNNATEFGAAPAGYYYGSYNYFGEKTNFWCATQYTIDNAYNYGIGYAVTGVTKYQCGKGFAHSVRCLRN